MQIEIIRSVAEFKALAEPWNELLSHSASDVPFLRHEYLSGWWQTLGGGEWPAAELYLALGRLSDGSLAGIAPLFFAPNRRQQPALMLLGSIEISDYLDLIAPAEHLPAFIAALAAHLAAEQAPAWQVLDLYNLHDSSPSLPLLQQAAAAHGWRFTQENLQHCPQVPLPGDFEKYLAEQVDKKQRHEIRRKMRRAEAYEQPVRWYITNDAARLEADMADFLRLMATDPEKERFLTPPMRAQMLATMRVAFQSGWLQLAFLEVNGQKAAAYLNFDYRNQIWVYNSGLDFNFRELSPGWVLLGYLLEWANQHGRTNFDFMRGDEEYKYRFGAIDRQIVSACLERSPGG